MKHNTYFRNRVGKGYRFDLTGCFSGLKGIEWKGLWTFILWMIVLAVIGGLLYLVWLILSPIFILLYAGWSALLGFANDVADGDVHLPEVPAIFSSSTPPAGTPAAMPWDEEKVRHMFATNNAARLGWKIQTPRKVIETTLKFGPQGQEGLVLEAGLDVSLMKGGELQVRCPERMPGGYHVMFLQFGEQGEWIPFANDTLTLRSHFGAIRFKGRSDLQVNPPFPVFFTPIDPPGHRILVSTSKRVAGTDEMVRWGILPPTATYDWQLYIRFKRADGESLENYLLANPAAVAVMSQNGKEKRFQTPLTKNERIFSSQVIETQENDFLSFGVPDGKDEFVIDCKLLIVPKGHLPQ